MILPPQGLESLLEESSTLLYECFPMRPRMFNDNHLKFIASPQKVKPQPPSCKQNNKKLKIELCQVKSRIFENTLFSAVNLFGENSVLTPLPGSKKSLLKESHVLFLKNLKQQ